MSHHILEKLLESLKGLPGFNENAFLQVHSSGKTVTSVRFNPGKKYLHSLFTGDKVPWSNQGYYLRERPSFTSDPAFHAGAYYVQEASSMFLEEVMRQTCDLTENLKVLDLCAAPGGKSTLIQSVISANSMLVSNEIIKSRVSVLAENITKWGSSNVIVTNNEPEHFKRLPEYFDVIVIDAPCSGSGLFRKDPQAINEWSTENVQMCSIRQQKILADAIPALKPGGILIYSTCSYSADENEMMCDHIMQNYSMKSLQIILQENWNIVHTLSEQHQGSGYRFYPDKLQGEGFFIAAFKKPGIPEVFFEKPLKNKAKPVTKNDIDILKMHIDSKDSAYIYQNDEILILPMHLMAELQKLQSALYIKKAGIKAGKIVRNELIPDHELAVSTILSTETTGVEVDHATALEYLRRRDVIITANKKGWMVIRYQGLSLGWIKHIGTRVNNYYPKEWRILNR